MRAKVVELVVRELYGLPLETAEKLSKLYPYWTHLYYMPKEFLWGEFYDYIKEKYNIKGIDNWRLAWALIVYAPADHPKLVEKAEAESKKVVGVRSILKDAKFWGDVNAKDSE